MPIIIRAENLVKRFRSVDALRGLNIDVPQGSIYALVGSNGAGKTTAIKTMLNILYPTSGRSEVLGIDSRNLAGNAFLSIGYISENQDLPDWMTVRHFLGYMRPFYPTWDRQLEAELLRNFDLPLDHKLRALSRGMRMKAALASSLAYRPKLIVLDEPFSGLDPLVRDELVQSLSERTAEATIFISSHDMLEIESLASHVGYLQEGKLLFSEEMESLSDRFREVEVSLHAPAPIVDPWPSTWLQVDVSETAIRFVESGFSDGLTPQRIRSIFGETRGATYHQMSLRSIFIAIAR
ncbi:MAG TPA: ABC transporter ATP-binding protein, partial [Bryobacteraceae bacterium]|nr:ABC transporter ATP-binding protein [Bryobacteraceae bacterium]